MPGEVRSVVILGTGKIAFDGLFAYIPGEINASEAYMTIGERIRKARKAKGWSQRVLTQHIESDASYINRIETGKLNPSVVAVERIAGALDCSLDQKVTGKDDELEVPIRDKGLFDRMRLIDSLEESDRNALVHIIDSMLTKKRMRELLDSKLLKGIEQR